MDVNAKAKKQIRLFRISYVLWTISVLVFALIGAGYARVKGYIAILILIYIAGFVLLRLGNVFLSQRCFLDVLTRKLDADAFLAILRQSRLDTPAALWQIVGEYYCGNYHNALRICTQKLEEQQTPSRASYQYISLLANVYFDIGDWEKLTQICQRFEEDLAKEGPAKQKKYRKAFRRMTMYQSFVKQDMDACRQYLEAKASTPIQEHAKTFCKARIALLQGDEETAQIHLKALSQAVPQLNFGKLALQLLAQLEDGTCSQEVLIVEDTGAVELYTIKNYAQRQKIRKGILIVCCVIILCNIAMLSQVQEPAFWRDIRVLVEQDYDDVVIHDIFTLQKGEEVVDTMFICQTDDSILVGCLYRYGGEETMYYKEQIKLPFGVLIEEKSPVYQGVFASKTSANLIYASVYTNVIDLPETEVCHVSSFFVGDLPVYFVVTEIEPLTVYTP